MLVPLILAGFLSLALGMMPNFGLQRHELSVQISRGIGPLVTAITENTYL